MILFLGSLFHSIGPRVYHSTSATPVDYCSSVMSFFFFFLNLFILFIYFWLRWVFVAARGLFSGCSEQGLLFAAVHGLLIVVGSLVVEHGL